MDISPSDIDKFWSKVDIGEPDECWEWQAGKSSTGYGSFNCSNGGKTKNAHKVAWEITNGIVPKGKLVCHKCDNSACCNPSHLYIGTRSDNICDRLLRDPIPPERMGLARARFYEGEIWLIRKLKIPTKPQGMRKNYKFSASIISKMFKTDKSTIHRIWKSDKYLCREGYYV